MKGIDYAAIAAAGGLGKGPTRREVKVQRRAAHRDVVAEVRELVFRLDPQCVVCLGPAEPTDAMNEVVPRSKTRGLPPEERFNRGNCCRVHDGPLRSCHRDITENRTVLEFMDPRKGMDGGLIIYRRADIQDDGRVQAIVYRRGKVPRHDPVTWWKAEATMVSMPVREVRVPLVRPGEVHMPRPAAAEVNPPATVIPIEAGTVQKPVTAPTKRKPRTGPRPVVKGEGVSEERRAGERRQTDRRAMPTLKEQPTFKGLMVNGTANQQLVKRALEALLTGAVSEDDRQRAHVLLKRIEVRQ